MHRQRNEVTNGEFARTAGTPDASADQWMRRLVDERDRTILECQDHADQLREKPTSSERAEYQAREQEARDRNSPMVIMRMSSLR